jgi:hypothetical protein
MGKASMEEVENTVMEMKSRKAPNPDRFTTDCFQKCWKTIKKDIWEVIEESRSSGAILKSFNATFIALITKEKEVNTIEKFRPIELCNIIYKIVSKFIANRLKILLKNITSKEQGGFIEGRQILDGIIVS